MGHSDRYDDAIRAAAEDTGDPQEIFERLAYADVRDAADLLKPVFDSTEGADGYVSFELPAVARPRRRGIGRGGPAPPRGHRPAQRDDQGAGHRRRACGAFEELTALGVNVNVTLLFSVARYREVAEAYVRGLERRVERGEPVDRAASVASFFVSRVDTKVDDARWTKAGPGGPPRPGRGGQRQARLRGASARSSAAPRWDALAAAGARGSARCGPRPAPRTRPTRTRSTWTS